MGFNEKLYAKYLRVAGIEATDKDGWNVTRYPNGLYCFATRQWLGDNGEIPEYRLLSKSIRHKETGKKWLIETACIHYYGGGYYYYIVGASYPELTSHIAFFCENINCPDENIVKSITEFNENFEVLD